MPWQDHVHFYLDAETWGGLLYERLLAAITLADGLYCGLVFAFPTAGHPTIEFWERIDDLERGGFAPIRPERARAISDALPRFLDRLDQATGDGRQATEGAVCTRGGGGKRPRQKEDESGTPP